MIFETERLYLRKLNQGDFANLCTILQDETAMYAYEHAFSGEEVQEWLDRQITRYQTDGFGLWAVLLKGTNTFIGQAGLTMQDAGNGRRVVEIGYLFRQDYCTMDMRRRPHRAVNSMRLRRLACRRCIPSSGTTIMLPNAWQGATGCSPPGRWSNTTMGWTCPTSSTV